MKDSTRVWAAAYSQCEYDLQKTWNLLTWRMAWHRANSSQRMFQAFYDASLAFAKRFSGQFIDTF
jgi:hypothetical protein